ncbi:sister chromatid cohesion protein PDS5 homolog A-like [Magnolia sinica]|uniref:sister chromatid cohesion protein PDS5 homolog A-like n=1 Tax=Magnolia sinica TaxID=86752 RepID=UPI00265AFB63|nr:sister chromatid cohesion protein PDS5 homolog A-like [Magnolia sinica]
MLSWSICCPLPFICCSSEQICVASYSPLGRCFWSSCLDQANEEKSWLADDKVLTHFESLKFENTETVHTDVGKDEKGLEDSDIEGAELPLGKIMKRLKSQRTKNKKVVRKHSTVEGNNAENDVDILGTSRKIKLDNQERATNLQYGKLGNGHEHFITRETANQNGKKKSSESRKKKKRKTSDVFSTPVPTCKRSPFGKDTRRQSHPRNSVKGLGKASRASSNSIGIFSMQSLEMDEELQDWSEVKLSKEKSKAEPTESDFLLSLSPTTKTSSRRKKKGIVQHLNGMGDSETLGHEPEESSLLVENDEKNSVGNFKSPMGANKKRKRRSIAKLAKATSLVSCLYNQFAVVLSHFVSIMK